MKLEETQSIEKGSSKSTSRREPHVFVIGNLSPSTLGAQRYSLRGVREVVFGRGESGHEREGETLRISIPDPCMSSQHARLSRRVASNVLEDLDSKNGVFVAGTRIDNAILKGGDVFELGDTFFVFFPLLPTSTNCPSSAAASNHAGPSGFQTLVPSLGLEFTLLEKVAKSTAPVMLNGPTGSGKELVARAVHEASGRTGAFVAINCGAIPSTLMESELFGHAKGAFSGAQSDHKGFLEASSGGTLFLDELVELPHAAQVALLRALEEQEVTLVGTTKPRPIDLRVLSATHVDAITVSSVREDLYSRLRGFDLTLPPLRERLPDIGTIILSLLRRLDPPGYEKIVFEREAYRTLLMHPWPRNIRELEKSLETAVALADGHEITREHLRLRDAPRSGEDEERRAKITSLLQENEGNITRVAEAMGKKRQQVQKWLKRYEINPGDYRK